MCLTSSSVTATDDNTFQNMKCVTFCNACMMQHIAAWAPWLMPNMLHFLHTDISTHGRVNGAQDDMVLKFVETTPWAVNITAVVILTTASNLSYLYNDN